MFEVFAIDEALRHEDPGSPVPALYATLPSPQTLVPNLTYQQMLLKLDIRLTRTPPGSEISRVLWLGYVLIYLESHTWHSKTGAEVG